MGQNVLRNNLTVNLYAYVYCARVLIGAMHDLGTDLSGFSGPKVKIGIFPLSHIQAKSFWSHDTIYTPYTVDGGQP